MSAAAAGRPIFEAILTPYRSMGRRGMFVVFGIMAAGSLLVTSLMWALGAMPVIAFNGADLVLAITLYAMNMHGAKASEVILLTDQTLTITRTTARGRKSVERMSSGWLRVEVQEKAGAIRSSRWSTASGGRSWRWRWAMPNGGILPRC